MQVKQVNKPYQTFAHHPLAFSARRDEPADKKAMPSSASTTMTYDPAPQPGVSKPANQAQTLLDHITRTWLEASDRARYDDKVHFNSPNRDPEEVEGLNGHLSCLVINGKRSPFTIRFTRALRKLAELVTDKQTPSIQLRRIEPPLYPAVELPKVPTVQFDLTVSPSTWAQLKADVMDMIDTHLQDLVVYPLKSVHEVELRIPGRNTLLEWTKELKTVAPGDEAAANEDAGMAEANEFHRGFYGPEALHEAYNRWNRLLFPTLYGQQPVVVDTPE